MQNPQIAIRCDASEQIGAGHLSRCLSLADGLKRTGGSVRFVVRDLPPLLCDQIRDRGHDIRHLPLPRPDRNGADRGAVADGSWPNISWEADARATRELLGDRPTWRWLIADHYALDARWESAVRPAAQAVMAIDDLADRPHACDVLLDQNAYPDPAHRYDNLITPACTALLGPKFALIRAQYRHRRTTARVPRIELRSLLVFFGAADPANLTASALEALQSAELPEVSTDVVVGALNPHHAQIRKQCASMRRVNFHRQIDDLVEVMARADLAIGTAGTASWERCCLGLPAILVSIAGNQVEVARGLAAARAAVDLGSVSVDTCDRLRRLLSRMAERPHLIQTMSRRAAALVDGLGVERTCFALLKEDSLALRPAGLGDAEMAWHWRNSPDVRRHSFASAPIPLESHLAWWSSTLEAADRLLLIGTLAGIPAGVLRLDLTGEVATLSIYLDPALTGLGVGPALLRRLHEWIPRYLPAIRRIEAFVKPDNGASRKAFLLAKFTEQKGSCFIRTWEDGEPK